MKFATDANSVAAPITDSSTASSAELQHRHRRRPPPPPHPPAPPPREDAQRRRPGPPRGAAGALINSRVRWSHPTTCGFQFIQAHTRMVTKITIPGPARCTCAAATRPSSPAGPTKDLDQVLGRPRRGLGRSSAPRRRPVPLRPDRTRTASQLAIPRSNSGGVARRRLERADRTSIFAVTKPNSRKRTGPDADRHDLCRGNRGGSGTPRADYDEVADRLSWLNIPFYFSNTILVPSAGSPSRRCVSCRATNRRVGIIRARRR